MPDCWPTERLTEKWVNNAKPQKTKIKKMYPKKQFARFIKTAQELGVDESEILFEKAFSKVVGTNPKATKNGIK